MRKNLLIKLVPLLLLISSMAWAQERTITGKVTSSEDGSSLPGVNVVVKGTTTGTVTDADGRFSLSAPSSNGVLVLSFIGLKTQEVNIGDRTVIDVQMANDVTQLSEVIVTGYGGQAEKRSLTGSVASVSGQVFEGLPLQSADRAIQGRLSGVQVASASGQPGGALNVRVRGVGSINASNDPLWIVDGVQMARFGGTGQGSQNPLASINPNDIETIDVLKDAAAAAIYGAQAANGVVIVTTKKGKKGAPKIDVSIQEGIVQPLNLYKVLDGQQFATLRAEAYTNAGLDPAAPGNAYELYGNPNDAANVNNFDWIKALYRDARLSTYDATISGADDKTSYLLSASYQTQQGQIIKSDWSRGTLRLNLTTKATEKLTISTNIALSYQRTFGTISNGNFVNGPFSASFTMQPTSPGAADPVTGKYPVYPLRGAHNFGYNVIQGVNEEVRLGRTASTVSSMSITYQIVPGLTFNTFGGVDFQFNRDDNQRPATIPAFASDRGQVSVTHRRTLNYNLNSTLNYSKKFKDVHSVSAIVGYEYKQEDREFVNGAQFGYSNQFFRLLSQGSTARPATETFNDYKRQGFFGQVKYGFKDKYLADFTIRRDGSSRFGAQNRYGTFYAGSVAWRLKSESFLQSADFLDDLKMRVSYGIVGNSEINNYDGLTQFGTNAANAGQQGSYVGQGLLRPTRLGADLLTWEEEQQISAGIDYKLFGDRIYGSVEYYQNTTSKQLFDVPLPTDAGFANVRGNIGAVVNKGFDIELGGVVYNKGGFKYDISVNFSTLRNEVTELPNGKNQLGGPGATTFLIKGQPLSFHYLAAYAGVNPANGKAMVYDSLGNLSYQPVLRDLAVRGSAIPTYFGGFTNNFSYKGLKLELFFQFQGGNQGFNGDLYNLANSGSDTDNQLISELNRWQKPGDITNVPKAFQGGGGVIDGFDGQFGTYGSTRYMSDASYVRLKQVTLSYNLPSSIISRLKMRSLNIFVQGLNLITWTKFVGIDPEVVANNNSTGVSSTGTFPNAKQYTVGLSIGF